MRVSPGWLCWWPGLPRLWFAGDWISLGVALGFGSSLNLLLIATVLRPEWLSESVATAGWLVWGALWLTAVLRAPRTLASLHRSRAPSRGRSSPNDGWDQQGLFIRAQGEYLQGRWYEAESTLRSVLQHSARDLEARLLLATLYRRTRRHADAMAELKQLQQFEGAERWQWEIAAEIELLRRTPADQESAPPANAGQTGNPVT